MYDERFIEGNLRQRRLRDIWEDPEAFAYNRRFTPELLTGDCARCRMGPWCAGGCRSYNYFVHGKLYEAPVCARRGQMTAGTAAVGLRLRQERLKRGWSQEGLCRGICAASYLSKIEQGRVQAAPELLALLMKRLDLPWYGENLPELEGLVERRYAQLLDGEQESFQDSPGGVLPGAGDHPVQPPGGGRPGAGRRGPAGPVGHPGGAGAVSGTGGSWRCCGSYRTGSRRRCGCCRRRTAF